MWKAAAAAAAVRLAAGLSSRGMMWSGLCCRLVVGKKNKTHKKKTNPTLTWVSLSRWSAAAHLMSPAPSPRRGEERRGGRGGGGGHAGEACKPLLSVCSRVVCQLSCSARQSLGEIAAYSAASWFSPLSWTWPRTLGGPLLSLILDSSLSSFPCPFFTFPFLFQKENNVKVSFTGHPEVSNVLLVCPLCDKISKNKRYMWFRHPFHEKNLVVKIPTFEKAFQTWLKGFDSHEVFFRHNAIETHRKSVMETLYPHLHVTGCDRRGHMTSLL